MLALKNIFLDLTVFDKKVCAGWNSERVKNENL